MNQRDELIETIDGIWAWLGPDAAARIADVILAAGYVRASKALEFTREVANGGAGVDCNPTVVGTPDYAWWSTYLHDADGALRARARAALDGADG